MSSKMAEEIVVGIDFGTTHTGVSWTYNPATALEIFMVDNWTDPKMSNANHDKVPSEIVYDKDGRPKIWGFEARSNKETTPIRWFKVLMDEDHMQDGLQKEVILESTKQGLAAIQKTAEDVVIDYLRCVWEFALETIRAPHQKDIADNYRFRIVITVPAIWNPQAMEKTRRAIQKVLANENWPVEVVQEPTAAAIYTLNHMMKFESHAIHVGDCYLVCDAGGGTVDLIAYEVKEVKPLRIKPIVPPDGAVCGSILLDRGFHGQMRQRIGTEIFDDLPGWRIEKMMKSFEDHVKRGFCYKVNSNEYYQVELGGIPPGKGIDLEEGQVCLHRDELRAVFDPVCWEVWNLIRNHKLLVEECGKSIKTVLIVGGFGMSNYLEGYIKAKCTDMQVVRPHNSVTAVCRGATMWGVERSKASMNLGYRFPVSSTISKYSYGVLDTEPEVWDQKRHGSFTSIKDPMTGKVVIKDQMKWLLRYGDHIYPERGETITLSKYVHVGHKLEKFQLLPGDVKFETDLYYCKRPDVPMQLSEDCKYVCTVKVTLKGSRIKKRSSISIVSPSDGKKIYKVTYDLLLELGGNKLTFKLNHEDRERSKVEVNLGGDGQPRATAVSNSKTIGGKVSRYLLLKG